MILFENFLSLALESAPWLVLGLVLGGLIKTLLPIDFLNKHLQANDLSAITKATILGAPLPLCSCGVVPAAVGLRKAGASKSATVSFLISTPETGVDSISVTYALMGPVMAIVRAISALFSAFFTGLLVLIFGKERPAKHEQQEAEIPSSCCQAESSRCDSTPKTTSTRCCGSNDHSSQTSWLQNSWKGIRYAFSDMLADIVGWLTIGLIFAAIVQTYIPTDFLTQWGSGLVAMIIMLLIGIPMYVCATASTPIAVGLILAGISPGVALVFLLSGPATNIGTLGIISQLLGRKTMWLYLAGTVFSALAAGLVFDALLAQWNWNLVTSMQAHHETLPIWLQALSLLILFLAALKIYWHKWSAK
ncbi:permease [Hydrogenovibrio crunogenus]|uniref:Permease n=1 Tax=Hydrogenovibrio crunogenus TaxID=39765 RepID=A0A4P7P1J2_9GAMM|nr:SO_0444 family Cu/Zn efflux transporter [Hydrogenovibrio crunogenus]QBZ84040.1 permease [Hydrogenovibrio crunogenus]RUM92870.1 MAG: permease [Thiomicrospira sp.]